MSPESNVSLQMRNTLAVPANARHFITATTLSELRDGLAFARQHELPQLILGGGSNIVLSRDYDGVVIALNLRGVRVLSDDGETVLVSVAAGENWDAFVRYSLEQGWYGLENLSAIPGSVGAAPIQNIGAYGVELSSVLHAVVGVDLANDSERRLSAAECELSYRDSIFKQGLRDRFVITEVELALHRQSAVNLSYPALAVEVSADASPQEVAAAVRKVRGRKLPSPADLPNAGSFFKNPIISRAQADELQQSHPEMPLWPHGDACKLAAGWLVEQAGWRGVEHNGVGMYREQALVLINPGRCSGERILGFAADIQSSVQDRFGVTLEIEPRVY
ncbi:UDP-N-acetylmuramate dehydrogenase [Litorivivens lipolytica]|uniref:UDP-N-acetylenolpyruvoylglucosamine reductase n=1 Tax=Litorivivens lipolytica TaxID=1524264 RepID=A0A7W4Z4N7_9GAMM|nr:UDP-N-acetylmuramate dehydrogenase [Litorivivens lipolytica]